MSWRLYQLVLHLIQLLWTQCLGKALLKVILVYAILIKDSVGLCYRQIFECPEDSNPIKTAFTALNRFANILVLKRSQEVIAPEVLTHVSIPQNLGRRWLPVGGI